MPEKRIELIERTMESDGQEFIKLAQKLKVISVKVKFDVKKGWSVDHKYCCPKHAPKLILNRERKKQ